MRRPGDERSGAGLHPGPWQGPVLTTALVIGLVLMALQLWLLTVALDLLLGGKPEGFFGLAVASGGVFAGGVLVLALLQRGTRQRRGE